MGLLIYDTEQSTFTEMQTTKSKVLQECNEHEYFDDPVKVPFIQ